MIRRLLRLRPAATGAAVMPLRRRLLLGLAAALLLLSGVYLGFYLAFPTEALRLHLQQEARRRWQLEVQIGRLAPQLPLGLTAGAVSLTQPLPLAVERLEVRPLWLSLVGANPGSAFSASLLGGQVSGNLRRQGDFTLKGGGLELDLALPRSAGLRLRGQLRELAFSGAVPTKPSGETALQLVLDGCAITGLNALGLGGDRLELGRVVISASGRGNTLTVQRLAAEGGALQASGEGTLLLANQAAQSRLNLSISLRPGANLDPLLAELLPLLATPSADGGFRFRIGGTMAAPALQK